MPQLEEIKQKLSVNNEFSGVKYSTINNYNCIEVPKEKITDICRLFKNEFEYDQLIDLVGVDRFTKNNRFEVIYNLWSNNHKSRIFLRAVLDSKKPELETVSSVWSTANWLERETYDMFGINFLNHPDLRRIYMMEEFEYYPLRKDYPLMGIPGAIELPKK
ncbi:MAG: NADH-quinone oxidoreductase subunit C [Ignavibacteriae bacterium]|nr:MAG: NADH-quinone oxidoreductase subunit C [Ignavibacteriota bacterium]